MIDWLVAQSFQVIPAFFMVLILVCVFRKAIKSSGCHLVWLVVLVSFSLPSLWSYNIFREDHAQPAPLLKPIYNFGAGFVETANISLYDPSSIWLSLWAGVSILLAARIIHQRAFYLGLFNTTEAYEEPIIDELLPYTKLRSRPRIRIGKQVKAPLIWGFIRPTIYLPEEYKSIPHRETKRHILAHELAHAKRFDNLWNWLGSITLIVFWFHPLAWITHMLRRREAELASDALAIEWLELSQQPEAYGHTLLRTQQFFSPSPLLPGVAGLFELKTLTERRIRMIKRHTNASAHNLVATLVAVCLAIGFASFSWADASPQKSDREKVTEAFLKLVDNGKYAETWPMMAEAVKKDRGDPATDRVDKAEWVKALTTALRHESPVKRAFKTEVPQGGFIIRYYDYHDKSTHIFSEQVTLLKEGSKWKIAGYYVIPKPQ